MDSRLQRNHTASNSTIHILALCYAVDSVNRVTYASPSSLFSFTTVPRSKEAIWLEGRPSTPFKAARSSATQEKEIGARTQLILHGRQVPWMLQHHHCLLTRSNRRHLRIMQHRSVPAYWW